MIDYKIIVKDSSGNNLGEFDTYRNLKFGKKMNNYGMCSFEVPSKNTKVSSLIALRKFKVYIYRDRVLRWAGEQAIRQGDLNEKADNWSTIICYDWLEQLNSRFTVAEVIYEYQSGSDIITDLIANTQAEDSLGITEGEIEETTWREKTYTNQNILEAIKSLANLSNGFDFEINNFKVLNIKNFIGIDRSDEIVLEYGVNVKSVNITEDFSKPATRAIVLGRTGEVSDQVRVERDDATQQTEYGLREYLQSNMEVSDIENLEDLGDSILRKNGSPLLKVNLDIVRGVSPTIDDFALGDIIRVKIKEGIYNIDEVFRIFEWKIDYDTDGTETLSLVLSNFYTEEQLS